MGIRELRRTALVLVLAGCTSGGPTAQAGFFATPSLSLAEIYDDNLFLSESQPEDDFVSRLSPAIEAGYQSVPLTLKARYVLDAEYYAQHPELDTSRARTNAAMESRYQPTRLLTFSADASYTKTQRPGELNLETGVERMRAQAERLSLGPSVAYRFDPLTAGTAAYAFTRDRLADAVETDTHTAALRFNRRMSARYTASLAYTFREFRFDQADTTASQALTLGGTYAFTPQLLATVLAGPRFFEESVDPEVSASLRHMQKRGEFSLNYTRSQSTLIGLAGAVDTRTLGATAAYTLGPSLTILAAPSFAASTRAGLEAEVYRMNLEANYRITESLSCIASYQFSSQRGSVDTPGDVEINRNVVLLGIALGQPTRMEAALRTQGPLPSADTDASP